jgi:hypothetical protein
MKIALMLAATLSLAAAKEAVAGCEWINPVSPRFILRGGEAVDLQTGLIWKRCSLGLTWDDDRHGCVGEITKVGLDEALQKAKEAGPEWRVPSGPELQSIVVLTCGSPVVDIKVFPDIRSDEDGEDDYWTTNPVGVTNLFYCFDFMSGQRGRHTRDFQLAIRLVRNEP